MRKNWSRVWIFIVIVVLSFAFIATTLDDQWDGIVLGLDLQGGFEVLFEAVPEGEHEVTSELISSTIAALSNRVDELGVSEPEIRPEGDDRIRVRLAGVDDPDDARRLLSTEARIEFRDRNDHLLMGGDVIQEGSARVEYNDQNRPVVTMRFSDPDTVREVTSELFHNNRDLMVIWMDFEEGVDSYAEETASAGEPGYISAATVNDTLSSNGMIESAYWTHDEALELAQLLNAGALPVQLEEINATTVGPRLGEQAMERAIQAGVIGGLLVVLYMVAYYRFPGLIAGITLGIYVYLIIVVFNWMNATLTLPGIAALVLGVGMAVDANILTYERIKEELRAGKSTRSAFKAGSKRSLRTIIDANVTTIVAAAVLFIIGEGAIQGFAVMLIVSIILSIITAVGVARLLLGLLVTSRVLDRKPRWFGVKEGDIREL